MQNLHCFDEGKAGLRDTSRRWQPFFAGVATEAVRATKKPWRGETSPADSARAKLSLEAGTFVSISRMKSRAMVLSFLANASRRRNLLALGRPLLPGAREELEEYDSLFCIIEVRRPSR